MRLPINKLFWYFAAAYLFYLAATTQTILYYDAIGYHDLAGLLQHQGWGSYFSSGPNREPLYPWFVSMVLRLADALKIEYAPVLLVAQVMVFLSMLWLLEKLLQKTGISARWRLGILLYAIFSPALVYTVFTEWSEIAAYPLVLMVVWSCTQAWSCVYKTEGAVGPEAFGWGAALGLCVLALTAVKAVMEPVAVFLMVPWVVVAVRRRPKVQSLMAFFVVFGFLTVYAAGTTFYKWENWRHNGQFVLTNRGSWALYGNTARRLAKLTPHQWEAAVLSVPTNGVECRQFLKPPEACQYWTFTPSDQLGHEAAEQLRQQGLLPSKIDSTLIKMSFDKMTQRPLEAMTLMILEAMKFMFWEYNSWPEFAVYPFWLRHIYENSFLYAFLHYGMALLTFISLIYALVFLIRRGKKIFQLGVQDEGPVAGIFFLTFFAVLYIFFHSFFYCSGRYAMPLAPLYLVLIAFFFKNAFSPSDGKNHS